MLQAFREGLVLRGEDAHNQSQVRLPNGYSLVVGIPPVSQRDYVLGGYEIFVPEQPHLFIATELVTGIGEPLHNIAVLVAHGKRNNDNKWIFANGQEVDPTVIEFNKFADKNGLRKIEAVLVCNNSANNISQPSPDLAREGVIFPHGVLYIHMNLNNNGIRIIANSPQGLHYKT